MGQDGVAHITYLISLSYPGVDLDRLQDPPQGQVEQAKAMANGLKVARGRHLEARGVGVDTVLHDEILA